MPTSESNYPRNGTLNTHSGSGRSWLRFDRSKTIKSHKPKIYIKYQQIGFLENNKPNPQQNKCQTVQHLFTFHFEHLICFSDVVPIQLSDLMFTKDLTPTTLCHTEKSQTFLISVTLLPIC